MKFIVHIALALLLFACNSESTTSSSSGNNGDGAAEVVDKYLFKSGSSLKVELLGPARYSIYTEAATGVWEKVVDSIDRTYTYEVAQGGYYAVVSTYDSAQIPVAGDGYVPMTFTGNLIMNGCTEGTIQIDGQPIGCSILAPTVGDSSYVSIFVTSDLFDSPNTPSDDSVNKTGKFVALHSYKKNSFRHYPRSEKTPSSENRDVLVCDANIPQNALFSLTWFDDTSSAPRWADMANFGVPIWYGATDVPITFENVMTGTGRVIDTISATSIYDFPRWSVVDVNSVKNCINAEGTACTPDKHRQKVYRMNGFNLYSYTDLVVGCASARVFHDPYGDARPTEISGKLLVTPVSNDEFTLYEKEVLADGTINLKTIASESGIYTHTFSGLSTSSLYLLTSRVDGMTFTGCDRTTIIDGKPSCEVQIYRDKNVRSVNLVQN